MAEEKPSLDSSLKLLTCSMSKCKKITEEYNEIQINGFKRMSILFQQHSKGFITNTKYQRESNKIFNEINKKKEALDYIKCRIENCNDHMRNVLIYVINNRLQFAKTKKEKTTLNNYLKLFKEQKLKPEDVLKYFLKLKQSII